MSTRYIRTFSLKDSLNASEVVAYWRFLLEEFAPVIQKVRGVQSVRFYSGAGALRADCSIVADLDDGGVYERLLVDPDLRKLLGRFYGALDLETSTQQFRREVTPALLSALSST